MKQDLLTVRSRSIMTVSRITAQSVTFTSPSGREVKIPNREWRDMNSPRTITVAIRPGDALNTVEGN